MPANLAIRRLSARTPARAQPVAARLALQALGADLEDALPRSLPPQALLWLRRLSLQVPAAALARPAPVAWRNDWIAAGRDRMEAALAHAARPALGLVADDVEAVLFADVAEMLACLALAARLGQLDRWWWRGLLGRAWPQWQVAWEARPEARGAAQRLLVRAGEGAVFGVEAVDEVSEPHMASRPAEPLAVSEPSQAVSDHPGQASSREAEAQAPKSARVRPESFKATGAADDILEPLAPRTRDADRAEIASTVHHERARAVPPAAEEAVPAVPKAERKQTKVLAPQEPPLVANPQTLALPEQPATEAVRAAEAPLPRRAELREDLPKPASPEPQPAVAVSGPAPAARTSAHDVDAPAASPPAEASATPAEAALAPAQQTRHRRLAAVAGITPRDPAPSPAAQAWPWPQAVPSRQAPLLFIVNALLEDGLYPDFTQPRDPGVPVPLWALLLALAQAWRLPAGDALQAALAERAGDWAVPDSMPAAPGVAAGPWPQWLPAYARALRRRLCKRLGLRAAQWSRALTLERPARLWLSEAEWVVDFDLDSHDVAWRLAGLDRDPGWLPSADCTLRFRFVC